MADPAGSNGATLEQHICDMYYSGTVGHADSYRYGLNSAVAFWGEVVGRLCKISHSASLKQINKPRFCGPVLVFKDHLNADLTGSAFF